MRHFQSATEQDIRTHIASIEEAMKFYVREKTPEAFGLASGLCVLSTPEMAFFEEDPDLRALFKKGLEDSKAKIAVSGTPAGDILLRGRLDDMLQSINGLSSGVSKRRRPSTKKKKK